MGFAGFTNSMTPTMTTLWTIFIAVGVPLALGFWSAPLWAWTFFGVAVLFISNAPLELWIPFAIVATIFNIPQIRAKLVTPLVVALFKKLKFLPQISETERTALKAGDVWIERELFSGAPNLNRLMDQNYPKLTPEEQAFLDGPVEKLCKLVDDWTVSEERELPQAAWDALKKDRFFGMVVPKEYGGLGFSAMAHSEVVMKLASRCGPLSITAMVPNSLGPAELLAHFGTDEQKKYYLPRLARGEEIPCFALTEPHAGSDAASIQSSGVVFRGQDGKLYLRLNWNKRWITLAAVSTLLGLAFRLRDPENLLGKGTDIGITCALIPTKTPGVKADRRHDPMGVPFYNCPTQGKDVVVPIDAIIGGLEGAGKGWMMLMECLGAGRGISLPAGATAAAKFTTRVASAHAVVRRQFGMSIGKFEGIREAMGRIAGFNYMMEAARRYTLGAIDAGHKPPVVTAIAKYYFTETQRRIINDGMDILAGAGISRGPKNLLASFYTGLPVPITVEGANILTRTLMIFGQGALRAHPFAFREVEALESGNIPEFDKAFWGHMGHVVSNVCRATVQWMTRGILTPTPSCHPQVARYFRRLAWTSAAFAVLADLAMATLGGALKAKGKTTGRFADILGWMYLGTATLRRFEAEGQKEEDLPFVHWTMNHSFWQIHQAFDGLLLNLEVPIVGWFFRNPIRWFHNANAIGTMPTNDMELEVAESIQENAALRERHTSGMFIPTNPATDHLAALEQAYVLTLQVDDVADRVRKARHKKILPKLPPKELYAAAVEKGIITKEEFDKVAQAELLRDAVIQVDDFGLDEYKQGARGSGSAKPALSA